MAEKLRIGIGEDDIAICGFHHHYQGRDMVRIPEVPGQSGEENFLALYGQGFLNMPWNKLYRLELAGRFDESLSLGEDLLFNLDYMRRANGIAIVKAALCHYIQDETGTSLSSRKRDGPAGPGKAYLAGDRQFSIRIWRGIRTRAA